MEELRRRVRSVLENFHEKQVAAIYAEYELHRVFLQAELEVGLLLQQLGGSWPPRDEDGYYDRFDDYEDEDYLPSRKSGKRNKQKQRALQRFFGELVEAQKRKLIRYERLVGLNEYGRLFGKLLREERWALFNAGRGNTRAAERARYILEERVKEQEGREARRKAQEEGERKASEERAVEAREWRQSTVEGLTEWTEEAVEEYLRADTEYRATRSWGDLDILDEAKDDLAELLGYLNKAEDSASGEEDLEEVKRLKKRVSDLLE